MQMRDAQKKYQNAKFAYQKLKKEYFQYGQKCQAREQELLSEVKRLNTNVANLREELKIVKKQEAEGFGKLSNANRILQLFEEHSALKSEDLLKQNIQALSTTPRKGSVKKELQRVLTDLQSN